MPVAFYLALSYSQLSDYFQQMTVLEWPHYANPRRQTFVMATRLSKVLLQVPAPLVEAPVDAQILPLGHPSARISPK